jgi:hypothetical protein
MHGPLQGRQALRVDLFVETDQVHHRCHAQLVSDPGVQHFFSKSVTLTSGGWWCAAMGALRL